MAWEKVKLGECIDVISGFAFKTKDFCNSGIPIIKIKNVDPPYVSLEDLTYIPVDLANKIPKYELSYDDILIAMTGSHINQWASVVGRVAKVKYKTRSMLNQRVGKIILKQNARANLDYIYYFLSRDEVKIELAAKAGGAANQANISPTDIKNLEIPFPSLKTQNKIADILSAYDNLIENNQKQIKLLEEAAQRLYKQWFIDLRYPGHETTKIVDGLPEGWRKEKLVDLASVQFGYAFDGSLFNSNGNGTPIVRIRNIPDGFTNDYTTENAPEEYIINNGDIVVGMDGEFHINSWSGDKSYLVQRSCCFKPHNPKIKGWLLWAIHDPIKFFEKTVVGATVAHLGKKHIDTIKLLMGPENLYKPFQDYFNKRQLLLNQNQKLAESRDRLLPKLMNGEII